MSTPDEIAKLQADADAAARRVDSFKSMLTDYYNAVNAYESALNALQEAKSFVYLHIVDFQPRTSAVRIQVIKAVMAVTGRGLKASKDIVDAATGSSRSANCVGDIYGLEPMLKAVQTLEQAGAVTVRTKDGL